MRFISMVKSAEANAAPPPKAFLDAMGRLTEEVAKAGCVMIQAEGLLPTPMGARVRLADSKVTVTDGPFTEAKEVVGGFAIFEVQSKAQILDVARRFLDLHKIHIPGWEGEIEIRQIAGPGEKLCDQVYETEAAAV
jgi:hypothetical protein